MVTHYVNRMHAHDQSMAHARGRSVARLLGRSLTSCIGENGTDNHLPHAKAFGNNDKRTLYPLVNNHATGGMMASAQPTLTVVSNMCARSVGGDH